jgi:hypothetical protein
MRYGSLPDWHDFNIHWWVQPWAFVYQINVHVYVYKGCIHVHSSWNKWRYSGCDILPQEEETIQKEVDSATECTLDLRMHRFGCTRQRRGTNLLSVVEILQTYASNRSGASLSKESSVHAGASSILPSQAGPSQLDASSEHDASAVTTVAWGCPPVKRKTGKRDRVSSPPIIHTQPKERNTLHTYYHLLVRIKTLNPKPKVFPSKYVYVFCQQLHFCFEMLKK